MAGRPKSMARKVTALEEQALALYEAVCGAAPTMYLDDPLRSRDEVAEAWRRAVYAVTDGFSAVQELGELLREKAGVPEPSPWDKYAAPYPPERSGTGSQNTPT